MLESSLKKVKLPPVTYQQLHDSETGHQPVVLQPVIFYPSQGVALPLGLLLQQLIKWNKKWKQNSHTIFKIIITTPDIV